MKLDIRHLQQILALNKHKNFARAARECNISQPGPSQSIRQLEDQLGYKHFDRNSREVTPTAFGRHALRRSQKLFVPNPSRDGPETPCFISQIE